MNAVRKWRENALMSRAEMARRFEIPIRTLEDWDAEKSNPTSWAEKLIIEKLMQITEEKLMQRALKSAKEAGNDEDGKLAIPSWAIITTNGHDEFIDLYPSMEKAINNYNNDGYVGLVLCNEKDGKLEAWFENDKGEVFADHDSIEI